MSNNIDPELNQIKHGTFGIDIRDAIHDAIEKLWALAESKEPEPGGSIVAGPMVYVAPGVQINTIAGELEE